MLRVALFEELKEIGRGDCLSPISNVVKNKIKLSDEAEEQLQFLLDFTYSPNCSVRCMDRALCISGPSYNVMLDRLSITNEFTRCVIDGVEHRCPCVRYEKLIAIFVSGEIYGIYPIL